MSHDRDFLQGLVNKVYEFADRKAKEHLGTIQEFLDRKKIENFRELEKSKKPENAGQTQPLADKPAQEKTSEQKRTGDRANDKEMKRLQNSVKKAEEVIEKLEKDLEVIQAKLAENPGDLKLYDEYQKTQTSIETEMKNWEDLQEEISKMGR